MRLAFTPLLLLAACTADAVPLPLVPPGMVDPRTDPPVDPDPLDPQKPTLNACEETNRDRSAENLEQLRRIGLEVSATIVEGRLSAPEPVAGRNEHRAELHITRVHVGPSFLEGDQTWVILDDAEARSLATPGDFIVGFEGNAFPTRGDDGVSSWWQKVVLIPAEERAKFTRELQYRAGVTASAGLGNLITPAIAVVEIIGQDEDRTRFRVLERLNDAELPGELADNWSQSTFAVRFPAPSATRYIASFKYFTPIPGTSAHLAPVADFRPETPETRAMVEHAIAAPPPGFDAPALLAFGTDYLLGWKFHRSPDLVSTKVTGLAAECCTGAGGTYVRHQVLDDLRDSTERADFLRGGHAYYSDEKCGDEFILGTEDLDLAQEPAGGGELACREPSESESSLPSGFPAHEVRAQLPAGTENRSRVERWMRSTEPNYLLRSIYSVGGPAVTANSPELGVWSQPVSVDRALAAATTIAWIRIVRVEQLPDYVEVTLETTFSEYHYAHQEVKQMKLTFACGDPRLLIEGAEYLAPMLVDMPYYGTGAIEPEAVFLIPGALLPYDDGALRTVHRFGYDIRRN